MGKIKYLHQFWILEESGPIAIKRGPNTSNRSSTLVRERGYGSGEDGRGGVAARRYSEEMGVHEPAVAGVDDPHGSLLHEAAMDLMYGTMLMLSWVV